MISERSIIVRPGVRLDIVDHILESYLEGISAKRTGYSSTSIFEGISYNGDPIPDLVVYGTAKSIIVRLAQEEQS